MNVKHVLMLLFIGVIFIPVVLKLAGKKEGMCTNDIYKMIEQKMNNEPITTKLDPECDSNFYKSILAKLGIKPPPPPPAPNCPADGIKCIADFGTNIGDPLCCGQEGVLQDTRYVCPNTLKKCSNFKCGSAFGTCSK
jgi:hypothetical protein